MEGEKNDAGGGGEIAPEDRGRGVSRAAGIGVRDSARGPRARLLLSGTRIQGRTMEGGEDGPGGAGPDPGAHWKMTKGPRRREVGEHGRASICVQPPRTSPCPLPGSRRPRDGQRALDESPRSRRQRQALGLETPLAGEQPSPGVRRGCGADDQTRALGDGAQPCSGKAGARRSQSGAAPHLCRDHPNTTAVVATRAGVHPGRGAVGAVSLVGGCGGFLVTRGGQGPDSLNVQLSRDSWMNYE